MEEEEDRISLLPDCLIIEILSRLPDTKYAIRTGTLSRRWQHLWTYIPNLDFTNADENISPSDFFSFIEKTLNQCSHPSNLNKFNLLITYPSTRFESQVNNLIRLVVNRNVKVLVLTLWPESEFMLHNFFFIARCFIHLTLDGCILNPSCAISWESLKTLTIQNAKLDEDLIQNILSGSPLLETFKLEECYGFSQLDITSKSVNNLVFDGYFDAHDLSHDDLPVIMIEINAPNILSLTIQGSSYLEKFVLLNVSSLVEAKLNYSTEGMFNKAEEEMLKGLMLNLCHVKELQIGIQCLRVFSRLEAKGLISPLKMKNLHVASP